jgi:hypothetical protein
MAANRETAMHPPGQGQTLTSWYQMMAANKETPMRTRPDRVNC